MNITSEAESLPKYTYNEIKSRVRLSHKMFHQIEGYVNDFLDYVPFDYTHLDIYSLKLVTVILEIGPELINSFELAVAESNIGVREFFDGNIRKDLEDLWEKEKKIRRKKKSLTFNYYYCFLDKHEIPKLSSAIVQLRGFYAYVIPFEKVNPRWWENYNLLKHDKYNNLKVATLRTALKATGALFWLVDRNSRMFSFEKPFISNLFLATEAYKLDSSLKKL